MLFTKKELIVLFNENNLKQPKAKYSNNIILKMLEHVSEDFTAEVECTRKGFSVNRGSLVECIIKSVVYGVNETKKSNAKISDLDTRNLSKKQLALVNGVASNDIEIKFSTSFAPATRKTSKARKTIIASENGVYMIDSKNIITTPSGKININNQKAKDLVKLDKLMAVLGY